MAARPAAFKVPVEAEPSAVGFDIVATLLAVGAACQSAKAKAVEPPKPPVTMSTTQEPWVVNGLVPEEVPRPSRKVAEVIVAVSGIEEVSKETRLLYCSSALVSPTRSEAVVLSVEFPPPPTLLVSPTSHSRPSSAATELKVTVTGLETLVTVTGVSFEISVEPQPGVVRSTRK